MNAISCEGIGKRYRIGGFQARASSLREALTNGISRPFRKRKRPETIWALRDISFDVPRGEVVGVIGRNGAGKSTLLKILSRITNPTEGCAKIEGRVGSLLEVGTGFHPELTGRENVFLNGAILGMRRHEIERKFDEIVDFAEVEKFIDTPVKRYSSGMAMRLAFAVAAHLEPEILLIDEVLAVGDVMFQRKCLGKMNDVASDGRTVLFVSHNLGTVRELCSTGIVLDHGSIAYRGPVAESLGVYARLGRETNGDEPTRTGWEDVRVGDADPGVPVTIGAERHFDVNASLELRDTFRGGNIYCILSDAMGQQVVHRRVDARDLGWRSLERGRYRVQVQFPALWLSPGVYTVHFKFLGDADCGGSGRYFSERAMLDVSGTAEGNSSALLAPRVRWGVRGAKDSVSLTKE